MEKELFCLCMWTSIGSEKYPLHKNHPQPPGKFAQTLSVLRLKTQRFPYRTVHTKANVKTNRMRNTKWTYCKERSFFPKLIYFFKNLIAG